MRLFLTATLTLATVSLAATADQPLERMGDPPADRSPREVDRVRPPHRFGSFQHVQVNTAGGANILGDAANEPTIAVDPTNPLRIVVAWRQFNDVASSFREAGYAYSRDGGRTWTFPGVIEPGVFRSDPVLEFADDGRLHLSSLTIGETHETDVFTSLDWGATWPATVDAFGGDKQWMAVDRTGTVSDGNIYQNWTPDLGCCGGLSFNRSLDEGGNFETAVNMPGRPRWGTSTVGPDGTVYVIGASADLSTFRLSRSPDAKDPGATPSFLVATVDLGGVITRDEGLDHPNPGGLGGQAYVSVDPSPGPTGGYVYALCAVDPDGTDPQDIHFSRSTDGGTTWSAPVRVNDDVGDHFQWFGTMSVAPDGRIDVIWNDTRNSADHRMSQLFYAYSDDAGVTWSVNVALSAPFDSHVGWPNQNKIGDYYDMESDLVGVDVAWASTFNGEQDVFYTRIGEHDCNSNGIGDSTEVATGAASDSNGDGILDDCDPPVGVEDVAGGSAEGLRGSFPNPVRFAAVIRFRLEESTPTRIEVFDVEGRLVRTLLDRHVSRGDHGVRWDGRDDAGVPVGAGVYFYRLRTAAVEETRRLSVVR